MIWVNPIIHHVFGIPRGSEKKVMLFHDYRQVAPRGVQKDLAFELEGGMRCGDHAMAAAEAWFVELKGSISHVLIRGSILVEILKTCLSQSLVYYDMMDIQSSGEVFNPSTAGSIKSVKGHVQTKYAVPSHSMLSFDDLFVWLDFPVMWWLT